jgi:hypothetical protein
MKKKSKSDHDAAVGANNRLTFVITQRRGLKALGTLSWPGRNLSCAAVSGDSGHASINLGNWSGKGFETKPQSKEGFCDAKESCWFCRFEDGFGRTAIGIHPDGGVIGATYGCIGLTIEDSTSWREAFKEVGGKITCDVLEGDDLKVLPDEGIFEQF